MENQYFYTGFINLILIIFVLTCWYLGLIFCQSNKKIIWGLSNKMSRMLVEFITWVLLVSTFAFFVTNCGFFYPFALENDTFVNKLYGCNDPIFSDPIMKTLSLISAVCLFIGIHCLKKVANSKAAK